MNNIIRHLARHIGGCVSLTALMMAVPALSFAASGHGEEKSGGLPQLDTSTFSSQIFWMVLVFCASYYLFAKKVLPKIDDVLAQRKDVIQGDIGAADALTQRARATRESFEAMLQKARKDALVEVDAATAEANTIIQTEISKTHQDLRKKLAESEQAIAAEKTRAITEFNSMVVPVVQEAVQKIIGVNLDAQQITAMMTRQDNPRERGRA